MTNEQQTANSKQQTANSKQQTANSKQQTANSKQQTANSKRQTANGKRQTENGKSQKIGKTAKGKAIAKPTGGRGFRRRWSFGGQVVRAAETWIPVSRFQFRFIVRIAIRVSAWRGLPTRAYLQGAIARGYAAEGCGAYERLARTSPRPGRGDLLAASEYYEDLMLLRDLDDAGRVPGAVVGTIEEAFEYLRSLGDDTAFA